MFKKDRNSQLASSYWLTRIIFIRCLSFIFFIAFLISYNQNEYLIGENGLTPAIYYIENLRKHYKNPSNFQLFLNHPTVFWYIQPTNYYLNLFSMIGLFLSFIVIILGSCNVIIMFLLWLLYFSIDNVGQTWYSFGWESQLLETSFLCMCTILPLVSLSKFPRFTPTSQIGIWGYRWLLFRIMLGAGLIKIRGDKCWTDLTCMKYHYETQPVPNPLSAFFHNTPDYFHSIETLLNHIVELIAPILFFCPRILRIYGGIIQILFQFILISSGNLSFLNWLTMLPAIFCFDDLSLVSFFSEDTITQALKSEIFYNKSRFFLVTNNNNNNNANDGHNENIQQVIQANDNNNNNNNNNNGSCNNNNGNNDNLRKRTNCILSQHIESKEKIIQINLSNEIKSSSINDLDTKFNLSIFLRRISNLFVFLFLSYKSYPVVKNLISPNQAMNVSFDSFKIVNSYGAFGSITKQRYEVVLQGTFDEYINDKTKWIDYEFTCKPTNINRTPCIISPYHYRIDWLMWFAAFGNYQSHPWLIHLVNKLLNNDSIADKLLDLNSGNPFKITNQIPSFIRAELYLYEYNIKVNSNKNENYEKDWEIGKIWRRKHIKSYLPPLEKNNPSVENFLIQNSMIKK